MKNIVLFFSALLLGTSGILASSTTDDKVATRNAYRYDNSFIFVENGITFSVYPDGEFDFYIDNYVSGRRRGVTFNSGFDYSPYAQYDDYGAVIQVENVPIFYDYYGRVNQIGDVDVTYNRGRVRRVGGMFVHYNRRGLYDYHTGYINTYNRYYTYRPFHSFFARPSLGLCLVFDRPYRRYYSPFRYTYYSPYRYNNRRTYATFGNTHRYNKIRKQRASVYRNDNRVAVRNDRRTAVRSNRTVARNNGRTRNSAVTKRGNTYRSESATVRGNAHTRSPRATHSKPRNYKKGANRTSTIRSPRQSTVTKRSTTVRSPRQSTVTKRSTTVRSPRQSTVTKRTVTQSPRRTTVTRSKTQYKRPQGRTAHRTVRQTPSRSRKTVTRSSAPKRTANKVASRTNRSKGVGRSSRRY